VGFFESEFSQIIHPTLYDWLTETQLKKGNTCEEISRAKLKNLQYCARFTYEKSVLHP